MSRKAQTRPWRHSDDWGLMVGVLFLVLCSMTPSQLKKSWSLDQIMAANYSGIDGWQLAFAVGVFLVLIFLIIGVATHVDEKK